ncbi:hypothetical protein OC846_001482 [Tilletia horrida]|uniref:Glycoside hydrolase 131 catalytic N-terminal domain-containing protein n=1 Tax=Tilletia horrida TaxID=155126 RepID=A0AAN6GW81_9BASI|nr:hypothetical protein OC845_006327 [Tilletia horrida]KAK0555930.1 hypothetical protein OC846_001482 [Tilletia horrida]KAK0560105.1 hypothetical protein OC861_006412 [Tilletia horrida]
MKLVFFSAVVSLALCAAASPVSPAERYASDLAAKLGLGTVSLERSPIEAAPAQERSDVTGAETHVPMVERIVGTVSVTPYKTGTLKAKAKDGSLVNARFSTSAHGVDGKPVLLTELNGKPLRPQSFTFSTGNSSFMGTKPSKGAFKGSKDTKFTYGHLSPTSQDGKQCVEPIALGVTNKPQFITKDDCSRSDDSSQLFQYWELVEVPDKTGKTTLYLQFVGVPQGKGFENDFKGDYALVKRTATVGKGDNAAQATYVGVDYLYGQAVTNAYQLVLV